MNTAIKTYGLAALALLVTSSSFIASAEASDRIRYRCKAFGTTDISMSAKHEVRSSRTKFSTEFEAAPNLGYTAGQRLKISVSGVIVGSMVLEAVSGGDVVGDLNFSTRPEFPESVAFPTNWPKTIAKGTEVKVLKGSTVLLGCALD